jgi:hypothetical protein
LLTSLVVLKAAPTLTDNGPVKGSPKHTAANAAQRRSAGTGRTLASRMQPGTTLPLLKWLMPSTPEPG